MIVAAWLVAALEVPVIGELHCSRSNAARVSKISDERAAADMSDGFEFALSRYNRTTVHDPVRYPSARAGWFQGHIGGGGNGELLAFDPAMHVLARCSHGDTVESIEVSRTRRAPPAYVPRASFAFSTQRGLRVGSTVADIERVYGQTRPLHTVQGLAYAYERDIPLPGSNLPYVVRTVFFVHAGRVVAVIRSAGV